MDISFSFQNSLGLLFKLCKAGYSEKIVNKSQKRISAGQFKQQYTRKMPNRKDSDTSLM